MEAAVWTVIGILAAALFGLATLFFMGYQHLSARIDERGAYLGSRIDEQGSYLGSRIDALGAEVRAMFQEQTRGLRALIDRHIETHH